MVGGVYLSKFCAEALLTVAIVCSWVPVITNGRLLIFKLEMRSINVLLYLFYSVWSSAFIDSAEEG